MELKRLIFLIIIISVLISVLSSALVMGLFFSSIKIDDPLKYVVSPLGKKITQIEREKVITEEDLIIQVVKNNSSAVVSIIVSKDVPIIEQYYSNPFGDDFFRQFFGDGLFNIPQYRQKGTEKKEIGGGTGFIISSDGMILTNKHVVEDEKAEYIVVTNEGGKYPAKVLARDPVQDVAILKVEKKDLPSVVLGDSSGLQIGQTVIAIGNALGEFRNTVSTGIVSGLSRTIVASGAISGPEELREVIQTDAAINPGNSGGPLLNLKGEVIGINSAIAQGAQNIGFAIPINFVKKDIEDVKTKGKISYPWLGVRYILINEEIKKKNNLSYDYGALVVRGEDKTELAIIPGSPADKAGIVENDIILEIDGKKINKDNDLSSIIRQKSVGDKVGLKVFHKGEEKMMEVILEERS